MFNRKSKAQSVATQTAPTRKLTDERDVLRSRSAECLKAQSAIAEMTANVTRLELIISEAASADAALQTAVAADGAVALTAFAQGEAAPDSDITTLLANAENSARAAVAARAALPRAQANLANGKEQITQLENQRRQAIRDFLVLLASSPAREYLATWNKLCGLHDFLVGVSAALPQATSTDSELRMSALPISAPRFNLAGVAHKSEWLATIEHRANDYAVQEVSGKWLSASQRLSADVEADVSDLLMEDAA
jgi:hypothetical protein